jgi:two-component system response regulator QseB/two-component system response regulator TctD
MAARTLKLLHVEDNAAHRKLIEFYLGDLKDELAFAITAAESEDAAVSAFQGGTDIVILDYHLKQGNGLSCLRQMREKDPVVPIIALSGTASPEVAAELLAVGADDYLGKQDLTKDKLIQSVRTSLARADLYRKHAPADALVRPEKFEAQLLEIGRTFRDRLGPDFLKQLDQLETASLTAEQVEQAFVSVSEQLGGDAERLLRPLLLEVLLRLGGPRGMRRIPYCDFLGGAYAPRSPHERTES